ncbi:hypothetical protein TRICI_004386 [Trichomonascus ciferrii]|uniref:Reverse transcriptase domain-containing protein n=1 Tax=Trichomonascus ciferrii TaxID=44093 RepID=A0A642V126_9ASCO|nr:hypothetical protein TRICI_004386 [Trichomonascus ciferrii]
MSATLSPKFHNHTAHPRGVSNHSPISLDLKTAPVKVGPNYWKLNNSVLLPEPFNSFVSLHLLNPPPSELSSSDYWIQLKDTCRWVNQSEQRRQHSNSQNQRKQFQPQSTIVKANPITPVLPLASSWSTSSCYDKESFSNGSFPKSLTELAIKPVPKPGKEQDKAENWRPISVMNIYMKIITQSLTTKANDHAKENIRPEQTVFIPGRHSEDNISDVQVLMAANLSGSFLSMECLSQSRQELPFQGHERIWPYKSFYQNGKSNPALH